MFGGSGNLDNLVAQARSVNRSGGDWYELEQRWSKALDEGKSVSVRIHINYSGESMRPDSFEVTHIINGVEEISHIKN